MWKLMTGLVLNAKGAAAAVAILPQYSQENWLSSLIISEWTSRAFLNNIASHSFMLEW